MHQKHLVRWNSQICFFLFCLIDILFYKAFKHSLNISATKRHSLKTFLYDQQILFIGLGHQISFFLNLLESISDQTFGSALPPSYFLWGPSNCFVFYPLEALFYLTDHWCPDLLVTANLCSWHFIGSWRERKVPAMSHAFRTRGIYWSRWSRLRYDRQENGQRNSRRALWLRHFQGNLSFRPVRVEKTSFSEDHFRKYWWRNMCAEAY